MAEFAKPNRKLLVGQMVSAEYQLTPWVAKPEVGTTVEEMLNPEYWASVAQSLKVGDTITVRNPQNQNVALLDVDVVQPFAARVSVRWQREVERPRKTGGMLEDVPEGYEVKHRGRAGWCVLRLSDGLVLDERKESRDAALLWLKGHLAVLQPA